jgi:hypothetical protein
MSEITRQKRSLTQEHEKNVDHSKDAASGSVNANSERSAFPTNAQFGANRTETPRSAGAAFVAQLDGQRCGDFKLLLKTRPSRTRSGWVHFSAMLVGSENDVSSTALLTGIASVGGRGVKPWIECRIFPEVEFAEGKKVEVRERELETSAIELLAGLIPPGGHLMIDYESRGQEETFTELVLGVPPPATHLGSLLFAAGFHGQFKDWYFSEGGQEGPRKLQANKPPDEKSAHQALTQHRHELSAFLERSLPTDATQAKVIERAKQRAKTMLAKFSV